MYRKLPQLLLYRTYNLRRKTAVIADLLGLNPEQADQLVRADPRLMTYAPETLQQRAEALLELLGLRDQGALRRVVMRYPSLLRKSTESIEGRRSCNQ
jgi:ABC-type proline/glycine betaine transport system ATPase subunit